MTRVELAKKTAIEDGEPLTKALNLDPSNTNRFIKHCDCSRINIDSVRLMVKYVEEI